MSWNTPTKAPTTDSPLEWSDLSGWVQGLAIGLGVLVNIGAIIHLYCKMKNVPTSDIEQMRRAKRFSSKMGIFSAIVFAIVMIVHIGEDAFFTWYLIFLIYWAYRYYYYFKKIPANQNGLLQNSSIRSTTSTTTTITQQPNYPPHYPHYPQQPYPHQPYAVADIWKQWAAPQFTNEIAVRNFMDQIQRAPGGPRIRLVKATMIANEGPCRNFLTSTYGDKWLFHGASEANASNIQSEGLLMRYATNGLLGVGLYGATDPRKAFFYSNYAVRKEGATQNGYFMFLGRYNCQNAAIGRGKYPGDPYNYEEFAVFDERHVVLLWHLKVEQESW